MNKKDKEKISKRTMLLILVLIIAYVLGIFIYPSLSSWVKKSLTPKIQRKYYVNSTISDENGEVVKVITAEEAYIVPLSKSISLIIMMVLIISISYFVICKSYKKDKRFKGISKIVAILEIILIFAGIFVFVYKLNNIKPNYGIYKDTFNDVSNLSYYPVVELPFAVDYLHGTMNLFERLQMIIIMNSDKIIKALEVIISISGAVLLPFKYCVSLENEIKKQQDYKKIKSDVHSQVTEDLKRKMKKERKYEGKGIFNSQKV